MRTRNTSRYPEGHPSGRNEHEQDRSEERAPSQERPSQEIGIQSDCEKTAPLLHRYVEGELDPIRSHMVERHLATCPACLFEKEQLDLERLWLVERALEGPVLSTRFVDKVMEPVRREAAARSGFRWWRGRAASVAAACLFALTLGYLSGSWSSGSWWPPSGSDMSDESSSIAREAGLLEAGPAPVRVSSAEGLRSGPERLRLDRSRRRVSPTTFHFVYDETHPIERGFRVGQANATFPDFGPRHVFCLPDRPEHDEQSSCELSPSVIAASEEPARMVFPSGRDGVIVRRARIFRVTLTSPPVGHSFQFRFRDTLGIALRLRNSESDRTAHPSASSVDPCLPDPNADGKTDSGDIAYGLQVLYGAQPPDLYDEDLATLDPECDGPCLRA